MLTITVGDKEVYDESTEEFKAHGGFVLELEHSLVSLSKWESVFEKPFLTNDSKSVAEIIGYVKAMCLLPNIPETVFQKLSGENFQEINSYIDAKMSATWFNDRQQSKKSQEVVTSELIYYWMTVYRIPFICETWHLNRLFTLIRICNVKQDKPKTMTRTEQAVEQRRINAERRARFNSTG